MPQTPIPNFHNARLSLVQSFVREMICKNFTNLSWGVWKGVILAEAADLRGAGKRGG